MSELSTLNIFEAVGPGGIKMAIVWPLAQLLAVCHAVLQCLPHGGKVPEEWETAVVAGMFKSGPGQTGKLQADESNLRPM